MKAKFFSRYAFALVLGAFWLMPISAAAITIGKPAPDIRFDHRWRSFTRVSGGKSYRQSKGCNRAAGDKFPVVQDNNLHIWKRFGVWAWPTIVLIDKK